MTLRSATFALFSVVFGKNSRNAVDFSRRGAFPNRENVYNEGKFFVFPRFRSFVSSGGRRSSRKAFESKVDANERVARGRPNRR